MSSGTSVHITITKAASTSMLAHMTGSSDHRLCNIDINKRLKVDIVHDTICKTGIDLEGLTTVTPKTNQQTGTGIRHS